MFNNKIVETEICFTAKMMNQEEIDGMYKLPGINSSGEILQSYNSHLWLKVNKEDLIVISFDFPVEKSAIILTSSAEKISSHTHESLALN